MISGGCVCGNFKKALWYARGVCGLYGGGRAVFEDTEFSLSDGQKYSIIKMFRGYRNSGRAFFGRPDLYGGTVMSMKLIFAIVNKDDSGSVSSALTRAGFSVTKLATTGRVSHGGEHHFPDGDRRQRVDE